MGVLKRFSYDNIVIHDPTAPDPVDYDGGGEGGGDGGEGGGDGGCTCTKDSYIVRLSRSGVLTYRDGETDVALMPSNIPANTGLVSITYVEPDAEEPVYYYYDLRIVELDTTTFAPTALVFDGLSGNKIFLYDSTANGFIVDSDNT